MSEDRQRWWIVCEAPADRETVTELADRVLVETFDWLDEETLTFLRVWCGYEEGTELTLWKRVRGLARDRGVRVHGTFEGERGEYLQALKVLKLAALSAAPPAALVFSRDTDGRPRREAYEEARDASDIPVCLAIAHPEREAWVLNGFVPHDEREKARLAELVKELGKSPVERAHELNPGNEHHPTTGEPIKTSTKRVLRELTESDRDCEQRCWREPPIDTLRQRGERTGLTAFIRDVEEVLAPLIGR